MPDFELAERHHVRVAAPADVTFAAAADMDLLDSRTIRAIFMARELVMGARPDEAARPRAFLARMKASPGIPLIRRLSLGLVKAEAERRVRPSALRQAASSTRRT